MFLRCLRLMGVALLYVITTGGGCSDEGPTFVTEREEVILVVTLRNLDIGGEDVHILRDVLETFGPENRLLPGQSRRLPEFEVEGGDVLSWVAGRNPLSLRAIHCQAGPGSLTGPRPRYTVSVDWNGARLNCAGWNQVFPSSGM